MKFANTRTHKFQRQTAIHSALYVFFKVLKFQECIIDLEASWHFFLPPREHLAWWRPVEGSLLHWAEIALVWRYDGPMVTRGPLAPGNMVNRLVITKGWIFSFFSQSQWCAVDQAVLVLTLSHPSLPLTMMSVLSLKGENIKGAKQLSFATKKFPFCLNWKKQGLNAIAFKVISCHCLWHIRRNWVSAQIPLGNHPS